MKKISILYDFLKELGGLERVLFFQANSLEGEYNPELLFSFISNKEKNSIFKELEIKKGIPAKQFRKNNFEILQYFLSFLFPSKIKKINTDLIISHSYMCSRIAYWQKLLYKTPYIVVIHHPPNFLYSDQKGWINNPARLFAKLAGIFFRKSTIKRDIESIRKADLVIANSRYTANRIKQIYGVESLVIYPTLSYSFEMVSTERKKKFLINKKIKRPFILAHGRIIPDKNYIDIIPMMKKLEGYDLIISGSIEENYKKKIEDRIKINGLENRVKILGRISKEDLLMYYNTASLFLMPAHKEDFGLTVIEAIASGTPVIAWDDHAGPSEILNSKCGILAKPYKEEEFLKSVKKGLSHKWDRKEVGKQANRFREQEISKQFLKEVEKII